MRVRLNHIIKSYSEFAVLEDVCLSFDSPSFNIVTGNATGRGNWRARPPRAMACGAWRRTIRTRCRRPAWKAASLRPRIWKRRTLWSSASWFSLSYGGFRFRRMDEGKPPSFRAPSPPKYPCLREPLQYVARRLCHLCCPWSRIQITDHVQIKAFYELFPNDLIYLSQLFLLYPSLLRPLLTF